MRCADTSRSRSAAPVAYTHLDVYKRQISNFTAITTGIQVPIKLNSRATLTPYIAVNIPMSGVQNLPLNGSPDNACSTVLYGGVTLSVRF